MKNFFTLVLISLAYSCNVKTDHSNSIVSWQGALKSIMKKGDLSAHFNLKDLIGSESIYGLGAVEGLKGEILIWDSRPVNSYVNNNEVFIDSTYEKNASIFVYSEVPSWIPIEIPENVHSYRDLEVFIKNSAGFYKLNTNQPFPFLIKGSATEVSWHIIDWDENDKVHTHEKHIESGLNGTFENLNLDILGFYSEKHKGIFTHHTSNTHMHFKKLDNSFSAHIDDIRLNRHCVLFLPNLELKKVNI